MNTYLDPVAFTRSIASNLTAVLGVDAKDHQNTKLLNFSSDILDIKINADHLSKKLSDCFTDEQFRSYVSDKTVLLTEGLHRMLDSCIKTDRYLNCGRYMSLCHQVYRARIFILLFKTGSQLDCPETLGNSWSELDNAICTAVETFDLCNILTR
ncbi:unnamed protein product [Lymnaea stagnalis]|uniref:Uncharacterized protein n=1 Tax=Lymnaea stagnalis TaxID=6523 RepID=A0AAV2HUV5_LYMST